MRFSWQVYRWEKHQHHQICGWYHSNGRKQRGTKEPLDEYERASLKLNIKKSKIMASSPITAWQIKVEKVEVVTDFLFLGSKITVDGDCRHKIRRRLLPGRKVMTNLGSVLKSRDLVDKGSHSKGYDIPSWTIKKAECQRIDDFKLWCWRRLLKVPWTTRRSKQSILREIGPEHSL